MNKTCKSESFKGPFISGEFSTFSTLGSNCRDYDIYKDVEILLVNDSKDKPCILDAYVSASDSKGNHVKLNLCK